MCKKIFKNFLTLFLCCFLHACGGATPETVTLPVPFGGAFTGDTGVFIAGGRPVGRTESISFLSSGKSQAAGSASTTWQVFNALNGGSTGQLTFFPDSLANLEVTPFSAGGVKRTYTMRACVALSGVTETCSSNFQCFEYPTDFIPSFSASEVLPDDPGAKAVVRKAICSGNNDDDGKLIDGKFLLGMAENSAGGFQFFTQEESTLFLHGTQKPNEASAPDGKVVFSLIFQGGDQILPDVLDPAAMFSQATPLLSPETGAVVGTDILNLIELTELTPEVFTARTTHNLFMGNSTLKIENGTGLVNRIPELDEVMRESVAINFADDPVVRAHPEIVQRGVVIFNSTFGDNIPIPIICDPEANQVSGVFRELCDEFGGLNAHFLCLVLVDFETFQSVSIEGLWMFLRP